MDIVPCLNDWLERQDGGCPIGRHELLNEHWKILGYMKAVREEYGMEQAKLKAEIEAAKKARENNG